MQISSSLDWSDCKSMLLGKAHKAGFFNDLKIMIMSIGKDVTKLSNEEVLQRSGRTSDVESLLNTINGRIQDVENSIVYASILGNCND